MLGYKLKVDCNPIKCGEKCGKAGMGETLFTLAQDSAGSVMERVGGMEEREKYNVLPAPTTERLQKLFLWWLNYN